MSIDLSEFHDVFFDECFEGLGVMESGLLTLDKGTDVEEINSIFRAAHSMKGGGASFGFMEISNFTHVMETLLDEMRDGRREVTRPVVDLLLESVDVLREMVEAAKEGEDNDQARTAEVQQKLEDMLAGKTTTETASTEVEKSEESVSNDTEADKHSDKSGWHIKFRPHPDMMKGGNDPARIFRELQSLADLSIEVDTKSLPDFKDIDPETSYSSWSLTLKGDVKESDIRELFSWVEDESDLKITPLDDVKPVTDPSEIAPASDATEVTSAENTIDRHPEVQTTKSETDSTAPQANKPKPAATEHPPLKRTQIPNGGVSHAKIYTTQEDLEIHRRI